MHIDKRNFLPYSLQPLKQVSYAWPIILISLSVICFILAFAPEEKNFFDQNLSESDALIESSPRSNTEMPLESETPSEQITEQVTQIATEQAQPAPIPSAARPSLNWKKIPIQKGDTLSHLFQQIGGTTNDLQAILKHQSAQTLIALKPGQNLRYQVDDKGQLQKLALALNNTQALHFQRNSNGFDFQRIHKKPTIQIAYRSNLIKDSLALSGKRVGLNDRIIAQLAKIFSWDIDFALDVRENDSFKLLFEEKYLDGKKIETGNILAAEFINRGHRYQAVQYKHPDTGVISYYSPQGYSMKQAFNRTPVNFTRISSHFNLKRRHPVLHKIRAHKGVDYAAPMGTPVRATGHAKVQFIGEQGGYGNVIILNHGQGYTTLYAHLSRFKPDLKRNMIVKQGDIIGFVGKSGLASGPHLHYEFRIHGIHRNPLTVDLPKHHPIPNTHKSDFFMHSKKLLTLLNSPHRYPTLTLEQFKALEIHG